MSKRELDEKELDNVQGGADQLAPKDPGTGVPIEGPSRGGGEVEPPGGGGPDPIAETDTADETIGGDSSSNLDRN